MPLTVKDIISYKSLRTELFPDLAIAVENFSFSISFRGGSTETGSLTDLEHSRHYTPPASLPVPVREDKTRLARSPARLPSTLRRAAAEEEEVGGRESHYI